MVLCAIDECFDGSLIEEVGQGVSLLKPPRHEVVDGLVVALYDAVEVGTLPGYWYVLLKLLRNT